MSSLILQYPVYAGALASFFLLFSLSRLFTRPKNRPPGPPPHPLVGHTFQVPTLQVWRYFEQLGWKYGPIVRLSLAGDEMVVLNDPKDAEELLGKRSSNYSSRKPVIYAGKYQSHDNRLTLLPYGTKFRNTRAAFHQMLQPRAVGSYEMMQERESAKLLLDMVQKPHDPAMNAKRFAGALVFTLTYGKKLEEDDQDLKAVLKILDDFIADCYPGAHLVDTFPILDKLPDFLAPWRAEARQKHDNEMKLFGRLIDEVKEKSSSGSNAFECFAARLWEQQPKTNFSTETIAYSVAFEAGTNTSSGTILWFLMAAILFPEPVRKAQREIDAVLGADGRTMPGYAHMRQLPYTIALVKEVLRWAPAAPGGFPHYSDRDDEYKGYHIPKHTMVVPNIWAMQRDPRAFPDPERFNPERFVRADEERYDEPDSLTEGHYGFGFGRRICPGMYLASKSVWLSITRLMWGFDIAPELDEHGVPLPVNPDKCTSGITSEPEPFPCKITPRSPNHVATIEATWEAASKTYDA